MENTKKFEPMLAKNYNDYKDKLEFPVYSQPKLDGIRCYINKDGMWTRKHNKITSCLHIWNELKPFFKCFPSLVMDGELYNHKLKNDFDLISGIIRKKKLDVVEMGQAKKYIKFYWYDKYKSYQIFEYDDIFKLRNRSIKAQLKWLKKYHSSKHIVYVPTTLCRTQVSLDKKYKEYLEKGYEGQMVRVNAPYQQKRTDVLLKRKEFFDAEYLIVGVQEGKGKRKGTVGKLELIDEKTGEKFESNIKGSYKYLTELWDNHLKSMNVNVDVFSRDSENTLIGKLATVKYPMLTKRGVPTRHIVIAIRDYE